MSEDRERKPDGNIAGSGKLPGGVYGNIKIAGAGSVDGDLEADEIEIAGSGSLKGSVKAEKLSSAGSCRIRGDVEVGLIKSSGAFKADGDVVAHSVEAAGAYAVGGSLRSEEIKIAGSFRVENDVEAERFVVHGGFRVSGLIKAGQVEIKLDGRSNAREIQGSRVIVKSSRSFFFWLRKGKHLNVELIEGDDISLEATYAQIIRGKRVIVGDRCRIDTVEYSESLEVSPKATVQNQVKT